MLFDHVPLVAESALRGDRRYVAALRKLVMRCRPDLVDGVSDEAFAEPLVFAAFSSGQASGWLEQLLLGYTSSARGLEDRELLAGPPGLVYVPGVGTWVTPGINTNVTTRWSEEERRIHLHSDGRRIDVAFRPLRVLGRAGTELMDGGHPILRHLYGNARPRFTGLPDAHEEHLANAIALIAAAAPSYAEPLLAVTRKVVLHHGDPPRSFAAPGAHGTVFLDTALGQDEVFFVEDLVHQSAHLLLNAASFDRERWFRVDRNRPLKALGRVAGERRTPNVAMRSVFTKAAIVEVLDAVYTTGGLSPRQRHELEGRLAFNLQRLAADLQTLIGVPVFAPDGRELLRALAHVWRDVSGRRRQLLDARLDNQGHHFDYERYAALNSPGIATWA